MKHKLIIVILAAAVGAGLALAADARADGSVDPTASPPAWLAVLKPGASARVGKRVCPFGIAAVRAYDGATGRELKRRRAGVGLRFIDDGVSVVGWLRPARTFANIAGTASYIAVVWCDGIGDASTP